MASLSSIKEKVLNRISKQTLKSIVVSSAHGIHDTYSGFLSPLIPFLIERLSLLKAEAGVIILVFQGTSILQPIIGLIGDRRNLRKYALLSPAFTAIFLSLIGVAPTFQIVLLLAFLAGLSSATLHATLPALVSSFSGKNVGRGMSIWMIGGELGVMISPLLITGVISVFSIGATPWLMIGGIVYSIFISILLHDLPYHNSVTAHKNNHEIPVKALASILVPMAIITIMRSPLRTASLQFLPVFLQEKGASVLFSGLVLSIMQAVGLIGTISGGILSDRIGFHISMILSLSVASIAMVAASLTQGVVQVIFFCILTIAVLMILPIGMALIQRCFPENRSLANGLYLAIMFGINALSGVLTGFMYDRIGGQQTFLWSGILSALAIPFVFLLPDKTGTSHIK